MLVLASCCAGAMRLIHSNRTGNDGEHSGDGPATLDSTLHVASDTDLRTSFPPSQCCDLLDVRAPSRAPKLGHVLLSPPHGLSLNLWLTGVCQNDLVHWYLNTSGQARLSPADLASGLLDGHVWTMESVPRRSRSTLTWLSVTRCRSTTHHLLMKSMKEEGDVGSTAVKRELE